MNKRNSQSYMNLSKDFILNILATLLSTGTMQLVLYPQMALKLDPETYGTMLTVIGIVNVITLSLGNNLCNARLLDDKKYRDSKLCGDYQILLLIMAALSVAIVLIANLYFKLDTHTLVALLFFTVLNIVCSYNLVTFRININYTKNLLANAFLCIGYVVGSYFLLGRIAWPWTYALAYGLGVIYIWFSSDIMREPFKTTPLFKATATSSGILIVSGLIGNVTTYLDRFIIHPILGGESVSVYATAAFFSKSINLVLAPVLTVVLSYITTGIIHVNKKRYQLITLAYVVFGGIFILVSATIGKYITGFLYPTLIDLADSYVFLASCGIIMGVVGSFEGVMVLAYAPRILQIISSSMKLALYLILGVCLIQLYGLTGMCCGVLITNTIMCVFNYVVGYFYVSRADKAVGE